jgi:cyclase
MARENGARVEGGIPAWGTGLVELAEDVFAYLQAGGGYCVANAGLIAAPAGLTAIDALFTPAMTRSFLAEAGRVSNAPLRRLIDTHHHVDHTFGNQFFAGAEIIAHARTRSEMQRVGLPIEQLTENAPHFRPELQEIVLTLPTLTYEGALTVYCGSRRLELLHLGPAHTIDDTLVYMPEERILFAGDVAFFYVTPLAFEGNIGGWIDVAERILQMDVDWIVPGHGPIGGKAELALMRDYLIMLREQARPGYESGLSAEATAAAIDLGPYADWNEPERVVANTQRLFQEFRGREA